MCSPILLMFMQVVRFFGSKGFKHLQVIVDKNKELGGSIEPVYLNTSSMTMSYSPVYFPGHKPSSNYTSK